MATDACPKPRPESFTSSHTMRLEKSDGDREVWRCVTCGLTRIESRRSRCRSCGGFVHENAPWWCTKKGDHGR